MRGKKSERVVMQKMLQYCDEIAQILKKHNFNREESENDIEFQFACGMRIIQITDNFSGTMKISANEKEILPFQARFPFPPLKTELKRILPYSKLS